MTFLTLPYAFYHTSPPMSSHFPMHVLTLPPESVHVLTLPVDCSHTSLCLSSPRFPVLALPLLFACPQIFQFMSSQFQVPVLTLSDARHALPCSCPHCLSSHFHVPVVRLPVLHFIVFSLTFMAYPYTSL